MKKFTLLLGSVLCYGVMNAQTLLYDNGPLVNSPGAGSGGADVSNLHDGLSTYGVGHAVSTGFKVAEDFVVPASGWTIDSLVFFAYQTGSGNTSTMTGVKIGIWDASPMTGGNIIFGDTGVAVLSDTYWSGIYRTTETALTDIQRPIMRNVVPTAGLSLNAGTYFVSWQTDGTLASGPWAPPITLGAGVIVTGDALQYNPTTLAWAVITDLGTVTEQGLPFLIYGHANPVGIVENNNNNDFGIANLYPVPAKDEISFSLNSKEQGNVTVSLNDELGKEIVLQEYKVVRGENKIVLDLSRQSAGVYFITVRNNESTITSKFIKE